MKRKIHCPVNYNKQNEMIKEKLKREEERKVKKYKEKKKLKSLLEKKIESSPRLRAEKRAKEAKEKIKKLNDSVFRSNDFSKELEEDDIKLYNSF